MPSFEIVIGKDSSMIPPPSLELLEDRRLLSGTYARPTVVPPPDVFPDEFTRALAFAQTVDNGYGPSALRFGLDGIDGSVLFDRLAMSPNEAYGLHRESERETLSSLVSSLENDTEGNPIATGSTGMRSSAAWEMRTAVLNDHSSPVAEPVAQPSALPSGTTADTLFSLDNSASWQATTDLTASGPFADAVFLDGWQGGLPAPQVDLVPAAHKDLTAIAAYLVGSASTARVPEAPPASGMEIGATDFIVGLPPARPEPTAVQPVAREASPIVPDRLPPLPPVHVPTVTQPQACDQQPGDKDSPSDGRQDTDADDAPSAGSESADVQGEAENGE
jgi:hypothetical protein